MSKINIQLKAAKLKAKAGEVVTIRAEFDRPCNSTIHERRAKVGYQFVSIQQGHDSHECAVTIHDDTTHFIVSTADNGRPQLYMDGSDNYGQIWFEVIQGAQPSPTPEPTPDPTPEDLGSHQYDFCVSTDQHICEDNDENTADKSDDWSDEKDLRHMMDICGASKNIMAVMSAGDSIESGSPKLGTPEDDSKEFFDLFNVDYWQIFGLRFFSCLGNHDFYGMFENRKGDTIRPQRFTNYNSIDGHNVSVRDRIAQINVSGNGINCYVANGRNRIAFDLEPSKSTLAGQADMHFMAYNAYVCDYAQAAGYTGKLVPSENRLSDDAVRMTTKYVNDHWSECRDHLSGWDTGNGMRNAYSKLNYFLQKDNNLFVFLSLDYGSDVWPLNDKWHDRMIHARTIIDLTADDPYIRMMKEYVGDTAYSNADEPYNYQYYSPNSIVWLKEILEQNPDKKIFIFTHHYLPHKVGNSVGIPSDGAWQYADIHPAGEMTADGLNVGSNCLTGIQFWFINKLNNLHRNAVWFTGHSHISWEVAGHVDCHDYPIVSPSEGGKYVYTKASPQPIGNASWSVALPSLSKPRYIDGSESCRMYDDAEMTVMEVYERGIVLKGYKITSGGKDVYDPDHPLFEKTILLR